MARRPEGPLDLYLVEDEMTADERMQAFVALWAKGAMRALAAEKQAPKPQHTSNLVYLPSTETGA